MFSFTIGKIQKLFPKIKTPKIKWMIDWSYSVEWNKDMWSQMKFNNDGLYDLLPCVTKWKLCLSMFPKYFWKFPPEITSWQDVLNLKYYIFHWYSSRPWSNRCLISFFALETSNKFCQMTFCTLKICYYMSKIHLCTMT